MIVIDANLLIYAYDRSSPAHARAKVWLEEALGGETSVGLPMQSIAAFLRLMTDQRLKRSALAIGEAIAIVQSWLAQPNVRLLMQTASHWQLLNTLLLRYEMSGRSISDAQIVTCALEFSGRIASADRDFRRFTEVVMINPLDESA